MKYLRKDSDHFVNDTRQLRISSSYWWDFRNVPPLYAFVDCLHTLTPAWVLSLPFPVKLRAGHCIMTSDQERERRKKSICNLI